MKSRSIAIAALLAMVLVAPLQAAEKVGYINVQKIVSNSNRGKEAAAEIARMRESENSKIQLMNDELNGLKIAFRDERQKAEASESELMSMLETIQLKEKQLKRFIDDAKEFLAKKDRELVADILRRVDPLLIRIAKQGGYTIIIKDANALAYLDPKADLSDDVVTRLNKADN